ncbi:DUF11 domain-containing protein [Telluribacter sp.]|jgi:uncharacterized repeat protein (TIGR01451 family)|uniref:DUF11 domain-containing protein n=1 Tax=Telluribacter sp. TaxID=1978767 RepID=UPI002E0E573B|nr:DUF11 domain-containing protein [Telluribacter sp.]
MKKFTTLVAIAGLLIMGALTSYAQLSTNQVKYQITFDQSTQTYTVWVVPQYNTPNQHNSSADETGSTAQVTLKIPTDFVMKNMKDVNGVWTKTQTKLGDPVTQPNFASQTYDKDFRYCAIGKVPGETNYGAFTSGTPVALFTFQSAGCTGPVSVLEKNDPFVAAAYNAYSLNVECSFYSRSGQQPGGNVQPLEQFVQTLGAAAECKVPTKMIDLSLTSRLDNKLPAVDDVVTITVVVKNSGPDDATGVEVKHSWPSGLEMMKSSANQGTYNGGTWTVGSLAVGDSVAMTYTARVVATGVQYYIAEVSKADQEDVNSVPDNDIPEEDDQDMDCTGAPIQLCSGQAVELSIPASYTNIQWFKNAVPVPGANAATLKVTEPGSYTFTATNVSCSTGACCPIVVEDGNCCPAEVCVPVTIKRVRTAKK